MHVQCLFRYVPCPDYTQLDPVLLIFVPLECAKTLTYPGDVQAALAKDPGVSVNRIIWSPDGSLFGML